VMNYNFSLLLVLVVGLISALKVETEATSTVLL
jgi:hypothetical protein